MIQEIWTSFSVTDLDTARDFYGKTLGLRIEDHPIGMLVLSMPQGGKIWIYPKADHVPASFTILNLLVADIIAAASDLKAQGVQFEQYENFNMDENRISRHEGRPAVAWFKDPFGNIIALMEAQ